MTSWLIRGAWILALIAAIVAAPFVFIYVDLVVTLWCGVAAASLLPLDAMPQDLVDGLAYAWVMLSVVIAILAVGAMFVLLGMAYRRFGQGGRAQPRQGVKETT